MKFLKSTPIKKDNAENNINENNENQAFNSKSIKDMLGQSKDIVFREIYVNGDKDFPVTLVFVSGLVDSNVINDYILKPLIQECKLSQAKNYKDVIDLMEHGVVYTSSANVRDNIDDLIDDVLNGFTALIFDTEKKAVAFKTIGFEKRSITEPTNESVLKGAKDSFVETLRTNTATIRRRIKSKDMVIEETIVGKQTKTSIAVVYMKGLTNEKMVAELKKRINSIDIDGVLTINFLAEYIVDNKYTPFPLLDYTERPDKFCADIIEGRAGVIIDGIPVSVIVPCTFDKCLQSPEDYNHGIFINSFKRLLRYILFFISSFFPAFFIAIISFHQEMIPAKFASSIAAAREGVPFPTYLEVFLMVIAFEILQEAGLRLPKAIGSAISIVGTLIIGEAAVNARIISAPVIIVVALTGISSFVIPSQDLSAAMRLFRMLLIILSSIIGLFGIVIGFLLVLYHLCTLESFGVPYLSPYVANEGKDMKDSLLRLPLSWLKKRPEFLKTMNKKRQK